MFVVTISTKYRLVYLLLGLQYTLMRYIHIYIHISTNTTTTTVLRTNPSIFKFYTKARSVEATDIQPI